MPIGGTASTAPRCGLAGDARRFDISPAWHSWVGQAESLDLLASIDPAALQAHCVGLANRFRLGAGLAARGLGHREPEGDPRRRGRLAAANVVASVRAGRLRLSFHLVNGPDDADVVADALAGCILG